VQRQLHEEPLWFNLDRPQKKYSLKVDSNGSAQRPRRPEDIFVEETDKLLLTQLNKMRIADNAESASENEAEEEVSALKLLFTSSIFRTKILRRKSTRMRMINF
jgi:hypothetical protein